MTLAHPPVGSARGAQRNRARGAPAGNQNARKHGLRARDAGRIDLRRTEDRRAMHAIAAIETALDEELSPQRALILTNVGRKIRDVLRIEAYEHELGSIIHKRRRDVIPVTQAKWKLLESIERSLERLGLDGVQVLGEPDHRLWSELARRHAAAHHPAPDRLATADPGRRRGDSGETADGEDEQRP